MAFALRSAVLALGLFFGALFAASPLIAAYRLHEAIAKGDVSAIEASVDFRSVRYSLKSSISQVMIADAESAEAEMGFIRRAGYKIGDAIAPYLVDRYIAKQVTPAGFVDYVRAPLPAGAKKRSMLQNIERARYTAFARFEIDVKDRADPNRRYRAVFTRNGLAWQLTEVNVLPAKRQATLAAGVAQ